MNGQLKENKCEKRNYYIDVLKGIAIISVIFIHTIFPFRGETEYVPSWFANFTLLFEVPMFFFLAGWTYSYTKSNKSYLKSLIVTQIKYMIFISLVFLAIVVTNHIKFRNGTNISFTYLIYNFFHQYTATNPFGGVSGALWFFKVYFLVSLLGATLIKLVKPNIRVYIIMICFVGIFLITFVKPIVGQINIGIELSQILFYLFFYMLGNYTKDIELSLGKMIGLFAITIIELLVIHNLMYTDVTLLQQHKFPPNFIFLLWSLFGVYIVLYLKKYFNYCKKNVLSLIGQYSIYVYFAQMIGDSVLSWIMEYINTEWYYKMLILFGINIIITAVVTVILKVILDPIGKLARKILDEKICA